MARRQSLKQAGFAARVLAEAGILIVFLRLFLSLGGGRPSGDALMLRPVPDAAEYAWAAMAMAHGRSPLMPIVNELHPSRYSILHPGLMSLWVRAHGGALESLFSYPPAALLIAVIFLYLIMIRAGVLWVFRLTAMFMIVFSPVFFEASREIMQESTLFMLLGASLWLWSESARAAAWPGKNECPGIPPAKKRAVVIALGFLAGASSGALACIRPTLAPLGFILFGTCFLGRRERGRHALAFAAGAICCALGVALATGLLTGRFRLLAYSHWIPGHDQEVFQWASAFKPPARDKQGDPQWIQIIHGLLGIRPRISAAGFAPMLLLSAGMALGCLPARRASPGKLHNASRNAARWALIPALSLFVLSQVIAHSFYIHLENRFFLPAFTALLLGGILGIQRTGEWLWANGRISHRLLLMLAATMVSLPFFRVSEMAESLTPSASERWRIKGAQAMLAAHRANQARISRFAGPVFVCGIPVLNARMLLNLDDSRRILAPILWKNYLYWDGHITQFLWYRVGPPAGLLEETLWDQRPDESFLYDPRAKMLNKKLILRVLDRYGQALLYFPREREADLAPAFKAIRESGFRLQAIAPVREWRVWILTSGPS